MGLAELMLLAVGLSMDAFAVSICKGLGMKKINLKVAVVLGLFFGGFQAGMPVIGWALGSQFMDIIGPIDHWIAFILLAFIGGKMLWEAFTEDEDEGDGMFFGDTNIDKLFSCLFPSFRSESEYGWCPCGDADDFRIFLHFAEQIFGG